MRVSPPIELQVKPSVCRILANSKLTCTHTTTNTQHEVIRLACSVTFAAQISDVLASCICWLSHPAHNSRAVLQQQPSQPPATGPTTAAAFAARTVRRGAPHGSIYSCHPVRNQSTNCIPTTAVCPSSPPAAPGSNHPPPAAAHLTCTTSALGCSTTHACPPCGLATPPPSCSRPHLHELCIGVLYKGCICSCHPVHNVLYATRLPTAPPLHPPLPLTHPSSSSCHTSPARTVCWAAP